VQDRRVADPIGADLDLADSCTARAAPEQRHLTTASEAFLDLLGGIVRDGAEQEQDPASLPELLAAGE